MVRATLFKLAKTVLPLLLGIYLVWVFFNGMTGKDQLLFNKAIREANYFWIIVSLLLGVVAYFARAYRWKYVLEPLGYTTNFWHRYHAVMIGYLVNLTIPRAGEASRSAMLYRSDGVPFSSSFGTIIAERAVDFVLLVSIALFTFYLGRNDFMEIKAQIEHLSFGNPSNSAFPWKMLIYGVLLIGCLVFGFMFLFKLAFRLKVIGFIREVFKGLVSIFSASQPLSYVAYTLLIWACYIAMFALPFQAIEETSSIPFEGILLGFIAGSLGITFTNGGIGSYPLLVGLVVAFYIGRDHPSDALAIGNALGLLVWGTQTLLMILLGLVSLYLLPKNYTKEHEPTREPTA